MESIRIGPGLDLDVNRPISTGVFQMRMMLDFLNALKRYLGPGLCLYTSNYDVCDTQTSVTA